MTYLLSAPLVVCTPNTPSTGPPPSLSLPFPFPRTWHSTCTQQPEATLGNSVSRWRRGGRRKNPGVGEEGGKAGAGGGSSSKVAVAVAVSGPGHAGEESASGGGAGGVAPSSAALSSSPLAGDGAASIGEAAAAVVPSAACSQPLEEVNPSILNAKGFSPGGGGGGGSVGYASASGKEEGRTPPPPAAAASSSHTPPQLEELDGSGGAGGSSATVGSDSLRSATQGSMMNRGGVEGPAGATAAMPAASLVMSDCQAGGAVGVDGGRGGVGSLPTPPPARGGTAAEAAPGAGVAVIDRRGGTGACASSAAGVPSAGMITAGSPAREVKPPVAGGGGVGAGGDALEGPGSRLKGKSVEAKGSTGVSPMQKRNRRELKVCVHVCVGAVTCGVAGYGRSRRCFGGTGVVCLSGSGDGAVKA